MFKKKLTNEAGVYKHSVNNSDTKKVKDFYKSNPFPNYKNNDDKYSILTKGKNNYLANNFKNFTGHGKYILEAGCGTGQLSNFFAIGTNHCVVGCDATPESLHLASNFAKKNDIPNVFFVNADIFDDVFEDNFFDYIWCSGVLHHTNNPRKAFEILVKSLKNKGYILIGLYNRYGRIRTIIRKYFYKLFGIVILNLLDPILRNLKLDKEEKNAWIQDQYHHPIESLHTIDEVLLWFSQNNVDFINSIPLANFGLNLDNNLFIKSGEGNILSRLINQFKMIFNKLGSDGGLFIVIRKKNEQN